MRNLKRALSLALAAAMLIGMMVVGASAAEYKDEASVTNTEAVDVLSGLGVIGGDQNGNFNPTATLTRAEFCVMIANALTGGNFDKTLFEGASTPFTDINGHWGQAYIAYCYTAGVIAGTSATTFSPDNTLTAAQASAILLSALGYNQNGEFGANGQFELNVTKWAQQAGLYKNLSVSAVAGISRDNTAQLIFNALVNTTPVGYSSLAQSYYTVGTSAVNGVVYSGNDLNPVYSSGYGSYARTLGFTNFNLAKQATTESDDFGRTNYIWGKDANSDGSLETKAATVPADAAVVFTAKTKAADVAKALSGYTVYEGTTANAQVSINNITKYDSKALKASDGTSELKVVNGAAAVTLTTAGSGGETLAQTIAGLTGNGKVVEIYANNDKALDLIVIIEYKVAKVTSVTTTKDKTTYNLTGGLSGIDYVDEKTDDSISIQGTIAKDDIVTVVQPTGKPLYVYPTTSFTGKMTKYNTTDQTMVVGGATYKTGTATDSSSTLTMASSFTGTANSVFYVDQYGYVVAVDGVNDIKYAVVDSIAYVGGTGVAGSGYVEARLIFTDGSAQVVKVATGVDKYFITSGTNLSDYDDTPGSGGSALSFTEGTELTGYLKAGDSTTAVKFYCVSDDATENNEVAGSIFTYSVSDDKYTLTDEGTITANNATFTKGVPTIGTLGGVANNNTTYVVKTKDGDNSVWTVYTGYKAMPTVTGGTIKADYASTVADGMVFCYVDATGAASIGDATYDVAFFFANTYTVDNTDPNKPLYEYTAVLNGTLTTVVATSDLSVSPNTLYKVTLNEDGQVTATAAASDADYTSVKANGDPAAVNGVLTIDSASVNGEARTALTYDNDTTVYFVDTVSKSVSTGSMDSVKDDADIYVKTVDKTTDAGKIAVSVAYVLVTE